MSLGCATPFHRSSDFAFRLREKERKRRVTFPIDSGVLGSITIGERKLKRAGVFVLLIGRGKIDNRKREDNREKRRRGKRG